MRNRLIRLAIKYSGNYYAIRKALKNNEEVDSSIPLQQAITILDYQYPKKLLKLKNPPYVLFYKGDLSLLNSRSVAVIGSRSTTAYGIEMAAQVVKDVRDKLTIISGMAKGIDSIAHYYANKTIGILGNGLDIVYPKDNMNLYWYMGMHQLLLSEYPVGVTPQKYHFPFRNRIIAALADSVIVVQAAKKSGTMITVDYAIELKKKVYSFPYYVNDETGQGCNTLIQKGAILLTKESLNDLINK